MSDQRYMLGFEKLLQHTTEKQVFNEKIGEYIADFKVESLLDIGAGDGLLAKMLAPKVKDYLAIESKPKYAANLKHAGLKAIESEFPVAVDGKFDMVLMSHVISYNRGNHKVLLPAAWDLVKKGGHMLIITHGNSTTDDWGKMLKYLKFGESVSYAITFEDILEEVSKLGQTQVQKVQTTLETDNVEDMIEALGFVASGSDAEKYEQFMGMSDKISGYIEERYRTDKGFSFPFWHLFVCVNK